MSLGYENKAFEKTEDIENYEAKRIIEYADDSGDELCGWLCLRPKLLQRLRTAKWVLFFMCCASCIQGMAIGGFVNLIVTSIERRFSLNSFESGLVVIAYDIASMLCIIPVSYFGGRVTASKPKWLGYGFFILGIGSLVFASPHFLAGPYTITTAEINVCLRNGTVEDRCESLLKDNVGYISSSVAFALFLIGQFLHGCGATPLFTLGVVYINESVSKKMSSIYLGIYYSMAIFGPAIGFVIGGQLLQIYTDFIIADPEDIGLSIRSDVWVGAWWLGFVIAAVLMIVLTIPLLAFPANLPGAAELKKTHISEAHKGDTTEQVAFSKLRELPKAIKMLLRNVPYGFINLGGACEGFQVSGFAAFLPKIMENQFNVDAAQSSLLMGLATVFGGAVGVFMGGYIIKKLKLKCKGLLKFCVIVAVLSCAISPTFFLFCNKSDFAGANAPYAIDQVDTPSKSSYNISSPCNSGCGCNLQDFNPVCGIDKVMYYSPCYAGCQEELKGKNVQHYTNCSCIIKNSTIVEELEHEAVNKTCNVSCYLLWIFFGLVFLSTFFTFISTMPALNSTIRCVHNEQTTLAIAIQWIIIRILGAIPGPIVIGSLIDQTCILWKSNCDGNGSCLMYKSSMLGWYMFGIALIGKICTTTCYSIALWTYKPPKDGIENGDNTTETYTKESATENS